MLCDDPQVMNVRLVISVNPMSFEGKLLKVVDCRKNDT